MTLAVLAPAWLAAILFLLMFVAAAEDAWRMEISDWISVAVAIAALVAAAIAGPTIDLWQNLLVSAAMFALGALLFRLGGWGGGDVKLLTASSLWFDLSSGPPMLIAIALIGGIETLLLLALRRLPWSEVARNRVLPLRKTEGIPYGIAIALGVALTGWWLRH